MPVLKKLNEARAKFHASKIKKTGHNKFAGYHYFELADFIVPALGIFQEVGLCAVVSFDATHARMTITDIEDGSECVITSPMSSAALKGCHEVQNLGAVQTYLRRYLWVAALEIVEHDAIDAAEPVNQKPARTTDEILAGAEAIAKARVAELDEMAAFLVASHKEGKDLPAIAAWNDAGSWNKDNATATEEKKYVWEQLKPYSKLRAVIKAHTHKEAA